MNEKTSKPDQQKGVEPARLIEVPNPSPLMAPSQVPQSQAPTKR